MAVPDLQDALDCLQKKEVDEAIALLRKKIDELPAHLTAHVLLARAFETKKDWTRALTCWENAHFLMPNSPVAREGKERVLEKMDQRADASASDTPEEAPLEGSAAESASSEVSESEPSSEVSTGDDSPPAGARDRPPSPSAEGPSSLDELRKQTEEESRRQSSHGEDTETQRAAGSSSGDSTEERLEDLEGQANGDLDRLIEELESARIEPDPNVEEVDPADVSSETEDLVSETLARIYEAQNEFRQAAQIYVKLASQEPDQARSYLERAAEMREKAEGRTGENG